MSSDSSKLRLALIGGGLFARNNHVPQLRKLHDIITVVAIWSHTKTSADATAALFVGEQIDVYYEVDENGSVVKGKGYEDLLKRTDIAAVDLVITIDSMPDFVEKALTYNKHVLSEKPMAPTIEAGKKILQRYREVHQKSNPSLVWAVAEQLYFEPAWNHFASNRLALSKASTSSDAGKNAHLSRLGTPLVGSLTRVVAMNPQNKYYITKWRAQPKYQGGYLFDGGVHEICKLRMIFGEVAEVSAFTHQFKEDLPPADTLTGSIKFQSGALATFTYTFTSVSAAIATATVSHDFMLTGTSGSAVAKNNEIVVISASGEVEHLTTPIDNELGQLSIRREIQSFALAALGRSTESDFKPYSPENALQDVIVLESLFQSAKTGTHVKVETLKNL